MADSEITGALPALLRELLDGADPVTAWVLNPGDPGLFRSLDKLSAADASAVPATGGSSIAAHVDHLCYGFELLNRWSRGENPFSDANYSASWNRVTVTETAWKQLRDQFRAEARTWQENIRQPRTLTNDELNAVVGSVVHLAYHLGAIRQIDRSTRGPSARD
ncbi:MAG TPA: DinB family protein [Vicinamibacterales bacterium]|nr:DinB family protein [Vicinamibacterales bacterium]